MLSDTFIGLAIAVIVLSSVAWVAQWRRIMHQFKMRKALRDRHDDRECPADPVI